MTRDGFEVLWICDNNYLNYEITSVNMLYYLAKIVFEFVVCIQSLKILYIYKADVLDTLCTQPA